MQRRIFERAFREYGVPWAMRTDNGPPFATAAIHGLSFLNVYWMQRGIVHQRMHPASPQENGADDRLHRTLKRQAIKPVRATCAAKQWNFDAFRHEYNDEWPHEVMGQTTPSSHYTPSPRPYPTRLPVPEYPGHFTVKTFTTAGTSRLISDSQTPKSHVSLADFSASTATRQHAECKRCPAFKRIRKGKCGRQQMRDRSFPRRPYVQDSVSARRVPPYALTSYPDGGLQMSVEDLAKCFAMLLQDGQRAGVRIIDSTSLARQVRARASAFAEDHSSRPESHRSPPAGRLPSARAAASPPSSRASSDRNTWFPQSRSEQRRNGRRH